MQFSIVSYLDEQSTNEIRKIQTTLSKLTGSTTSLTSWQPHITVGDGVVLNQEKLNEFQASLQQFAKNISPFSIQIAGFGSKDNRRGGQNERTTPYALYAGVIVNEQLLQMVNHVTNLTGEHETWYKMPTPYTPHITLAFRDLNQEGYEKGLQYLSSKTLSMNATIDHIALVEKQPGSDRETLRVVFG